MIHGSGDCAARVVKILLEQEWDCLAVPLPASFGLDLHEAIGHLPAISVVTQDEPYSEDQKRAASYVPVDPCQPVIAALRVALEERRPVRYIDLETASFQPYSIHLPDAYALHQLSLEKFAAAVTPLLPQLPEGQPTDRVEYMARRLRQLESEFERIAMVCSLVDFPWIRRAYLSPQGHPEPDETTETRIHSVSRRTLMFALGEFPFITAIHERNRALGGEPGKVLSIDGIRDLLFQARRHYQDKLKSRARKLPPHLFATYLRYVRNLCLIRHRLSPDLYTLIVAAQQLAGDQFALSLLQTANEYLLEEAPYPEIQMGIERARFSSAEKGASGGEIVQMKNRLPPPPLTWCNCQLRPDPPPKLHERWKIQWNPFGICTWPPEDEAIERFRTHVSAQATQLLGQDLARYEKFTTSMYDGLDIRETLRNWHKNQIYVKIIPPSQSPLDAVLMLFDSPADPRDYPYRTTLFAEHEEESTLASFSTNPHEDMVGPGIGVARYGGVMFLFPPRMIPEVWTNPDFDFATTLEERLLAATCYYAKSRHIALVSPGPPGPAWRGIAKKFKKKIIHIPLSRFSQSTVEQLRIFHILNGKQVRSYAAHFIRKA